MTVPEFRSEADLSAVVRDWLEEQGLAVAAEFHTGYGIADFVACEFEQDAISRRVLARQVEPLGSLGTIEALFDALRSSYGQESQVGRYQGSLGRLVRRRVLARARDGTYTLTADWLPMTRRLVAVECKLDRVRDALAQAKGNQAFSTESFIALPETVAVRSIQSYGESLADAGIGVLAVAPGRATVLLGPAATTDAAMRSELAMQVHVAERMWRRVASNRQAVSH